MDNHLLTTIRLLAGDEEVTQEEKLELRLRSGKYNLVRFLYTEKMKGTGLVDFHFSPGDNFMETPTIDIVNSLLDMNEQMKNAVPLDFGDLSLRKSDPPHTGRQKTTLGE